MTFKSGDCRKGNYQKDTLNPRVKNGTQTKKIMTSQHDLSSQVCAERAITKKIH